MSKYPLNFKLVAIAAPKLLFWTIYSLNFTHRPIHYIYQFAFKILTEYAPEIHVMLEMFLSVRERNCKNYRIIPLRCWKFLARRLSSCFAFQQHIWIHTLQTKKKSLKSLKPISFNFKKAITDLDIRDCTSQTLISKPKQTKVPFFQLLIGGIYI